MVLVIALSAAFSSALWRQAHFLSVFSAAPAILIAWLVCLRSRYQIVALAVGLSGIFVGVIGFSTNVLLAATYLPVIGLEVGITVASTLWFCGGPPVITRTRDLLIFLGSAAVGIACGSIPGGYFNIHASHVSWAMCSARWFASHITGVIVVGLFGLSIERENVRLSAIKIIRKSL